MECQHCTMSREPPCSTSHQIKEWLRGRSSAQPPHQRRANGAIQIWGSCSTRSKVAKCKVRHHWLKMATQGRTVLASHLSLLMEPRQPLMSLLTATCLSSGKELQAWKAKLTRTAWHPMLVQHSHQLRLRKDSSTMTRQEHQNQSPWSLSVLRSAHRRKKTKHTSRKGSGKQELAYRPLMSQEVLQKT